MTSSTTLPDGNVVAYVSRNRSAVSRSASVGSSNVHGADRPDPYLTAIPAAVAIEALRTISDHLTFAIGIDPPDLIRDRNELVAAVLIDLASNIEAGMSELWRSNDTGAVFIATAAIEMADDVTGGRR